MSSLTLEDIDSVSEIDRDTVPPLPPPAWNPNAYNPYGPTYMPPPPLPPTNYMPSKPFNYSQVPDAASYVSVPGGNGSVGSGSGESPASRCGMACRSVSLSWVGVCMWRVQKRA